VNSQTENDIITRHQGGQSIRGIARDLGLSRRRVADTIAAHQQARNHETGSSQLPQPVAERGSKVDAFLPQIQQLLARYPDITYTRIHEELQRLGYPVRSA
jgi:uncharacterized protein (DUF433 family)